MTDLQKLRKELQEWLDADGGWKKGEAVLADSKEAARFRHGSEYPLTLVVEGSPLYAAVNYGEPSWSLYEEMKKIARKNNHYVEIGHPGFVHFQEM